MANKISPELNRARVKESMKNIDRLNIYLEKGTIDRIKEYRLKPSTFAKNLIMEELERMDKIKNDLKGSGQIEK